MRLLDQVAQSGDLAPRCLEGEPSGLASLKEALEDCPARYTLAPDSARFTRELILNQSDLLNASTDIIRVPASECWIEWTEEASGTEPSFRIGAFVESDSEGRAGVITIVMEQTRGGPAIAPARFQFDFDQFLAPTCDGLRFSVRHDLLDLSDFFACVHGEIDPAYAANLLRSGPHNRLAGEKRRMAQSLWMLPTMVFAFLLVLNATKQIEARPVDLSALNRRRLSRGKPKLLDHSEVCLFNSTRANTADGALRHDTSDLRSSARLHHVRGHFVRRGDLLFWRRPHLRGDKENSAVVKRNRHVTMSALR